VRQTQLEHEPARERAAAPCAPRAAAQLHRPPARTQILSEAPEGDDGLSHARRGRRGCESGRGRTGEAQHRDVGAQIGGEHLGFIRVAVLQDAHRVGAFERLGCGHEQPAPPHECRLSHALRLDGEHAGCGVLEDRRALGVQLR